VTVARSARSRKHVGSRKSGRAAKIESFASVWMKGSRSVRVLEGLEKESSIRS
jgi:hypothetical protein